MHYIIGTSIRVNQSARQSQGPRVVTAMPVKRSNRTPFETGKTYTLYMIAQNGDKLQYTFRGSGSDDIVMDFDSSKSADAYISNILGESVPDYDGFYKKRSD